MFDVTTMSAHELEAQRKLCQYLIDSTQAGKELRAVHMPHKHAVDGTMVDGPAVNWTLTVSKPKLEPSTRVDWEWGI